MCAPAGQWVRTIRYFFLSFEAGFVLFVGFEGEVLEGVVFFAEAGFEARGFLAADGFTVSAAVFFVDAVFTTAFLADLGRGSVLREAEARTGSLVSAGAEACCLAASRQFGKKSSIRWREIELARRQRGQCAS